MSNEASQPAVSGLPPLPVRYNTGNDIGDGPELYTRDQMREYARAAQRLAIEAAGKAACFVDLDVLRGVQSGKYERGSYVAEADEGDIPLFLHPSPSNSVMVEAATALTLCSHAVSAEVFDIPYLLALARQLRTASSGEDAA